MCYHDTFSNVIVKVGAMPDVSDEVLHCVFDIRKRKSEDGKRWADGVRIDLNTCM